MSGRKGKDLSFADRYEVFRFARKGYAALFAIAVIERANAYGVACGYVFFLVSVVNDAGKFRVEPLEHLGAVKLVHREYYLAIAPRNKAMALAFENLLFLAEAVQLAVADDEIVFETERLHTVLVKPHDCESMKSDISVVGLFENAHIGTARERFVERFFCLVRAYGFVCKAENRTHIGDNAPLNFNYHTLKREQCQVNSRPTADLF